MLNVLETKVVRQYGTKVSNYSVCGQLTEVLCQVLMRWEGIFVCDSVYS
jgi:hypothetical protein